MDILTEIVNYKRIEIQENKSLFPVKLLEKSIYFESKPVSLKKYIQREDMIGIIAEYKRKSPSKGPINPHVSVERTSIGYMQAGASGLSILTDNKYFGGNLEDLTIARKFNYCPILRKDFIIDEYQIIESKSIGADVILLIAATLTDNDIKRLSAFAKTFSLEVLLEIHNEAELARSFNKDIDLIGVNNRDLKTFTTSVETSKNLADKIPDNFVKVSESGISSPDVVKDLMDHGYEGFLIGEHFMRHARPDKACGRFIKEVKQLLPQI